MLIRIVNAYLWVYSKALSVVLTVMYRILKKEQFVHFLAGLAQVYTSVGQTLMIRAVNFAIENNVEVTGGEPTAAQPSHDEDDGPPMNIPPGMQTALLAASSNAKEELPVFKAEDGAILPYCFDPLPEYPVFEALYAAKYGRFGRCAALVMGKQHVFTSAELYAFLSKIASDEKAPAPLRAFYGAMVTIIVNRHGHVFESKAVS